MPLEEAAQVEGTLQNLSNLLFLDIYALEASFLLSRDVNYDSYHVYSN